MQDGTGYNLPRRDGGGGSGSGCKRVRRSAGVPHLSQLLAPLIVIPQHERCSGVGVELQARDAEAPHVYLSTTYVALLRRDILSTLMGTVYASAPAYLDTTSNCAVQAYVGKYALPVVAT